jgi:hypothetical protein
MRRYPLVIPVLATLTPGPLAAPEPLPPADFHVAVTGSDENPGTADRPFATLARARDAVRERIRAGLKADVTGPDPGRNVRTGGAAEVRPGGFRDGATCHHLPSLSR